MSYINLSQQNVYEENVENEISIKIFLAGLKMRVKGVTQSCYL